MAFLAIATLTDLLRRRIPDPLSASSAVAIGTQAFGDGRAAGLGRALGWAVVALLPLLIAHLVNPDGMGAGDVKAAAVIGLGFGAEGAIVIVVAASLAAMFGGMAAMVEGDARPGAREVPLAPFMLAGALATICLV